MPRFLPLPSTAALAAGATAVAVLAPHAGAAPPVDGGVLYESIQVGDGPRPSGRVDVVRPDGSERRTFLRTAAGTVIGLLNVAADGGTVAYVRSTLVPAARGRAAYRRVALQVVPAGGGAPKTVDAGRFAIQSVALSPDARTVYYAKFRPASPTSIAESDFRRSEIYAVPATGGTARRLTRDAVDDYGLAVGPDGRLSWTRDTRGRSGTDAWSMAPDGTDRRRLDRSAANLETADVAADGRLLATRTAPGARRQQLVAVRPDGSDVTPVGPLTSRGWSVAAWSPDGLRIAALRAVGPARNGRYGVVHVSVATGSVLRAFAPRAGESTLSVDWAPSPPSARAGAVSRHG